MSTTKSLSNDTKIVIPRHQNVVRINAKSRKLRGVLPIPHPPPLPKPLSKPNLNNPLTITYSQPNPVDKPDFDDEAPTIPCPDKHSPSTTKRKRSISLVRIGSIILAMSVTAGTSYLWFHSQRTEQSNISEPAQQMQVEKITPIDNQTIVNPMAYDDSSDAGVNNITVKPVESKPKIETPKIPRKVSPKPNQSALDRRWGI
jgi:hypothetical protein